jgi:hypothetical protein
MEKGRNISYCLLASTASTSTLAATIVGNAEKMRCQAQIHLRKSSDNNYEDKWWLLMLTSKF